MHFYALHYVHVQIPYEYRLHLYVLLCAHVQIPYQYMASMSIHVLYLSGEINPHLQIEVR